MNEKVIERCKLLVENYNTILQGFSNDGSTLILAGSSIYTGLNKEADLEKMKECKKIFKANTSIFSEFGGYSKLPLLCKMAISEDPEKYLESIKNIVEQLQVFKWNSPDYKILAAMIIYEHVAPEQYSQTIEKVVNLYQNMKENHPWLTSSEDIPLATVLAVSGVDMDALSTNMEACYKELSNVFFDKNALQSLSHVLAVNEKETSEKCNKIEQLFNLLKERNHKYGMGDELAVLGALSMLDIPNETIADEMIEADEYLLTQKGFGNIVLGEKARRMYAALMVIDTHMPMETASHESVLTSMISLAISMEVCMVIVMTNMIITTSH